MSKPLLSEVFSNHWAYSEGPHCSSNIWNLTPSHHQFSEKAFMCSLLLDFLPPDFPQKFLGWEGSAHPETS